MITVDKTVVDERSLCKGKLACVTVNVHAEYLGIQHSNPYEQQNARFVFHSTTTENISRFLLSPAKHFSVSLQYFVKKEERLIKTLNNILQTARN